MSIIGVLAIGPVVGALAGAVKLARGAQARRARRAALDKRSLARIRYVCFATGCYGEMLPTGHSDMMSSGAVLYEHACNACGATVVLKKEYPFSLRVPM